MHVSKQSPGRERGESFVDFLTRLRDWAGIGSNVELAERVREAGNPNFNPSIISKWKTGVTDPSLDSLRIIARVLGVDPALLFIESGLVHPEDFGNRPHPRLYNELIELDRQMESHDLEVVRDKELTLLRRHVEMLIDRTIEYIRDHQEAAGKPARLQRRRRAS